MWSRLTTLREEGVKKLIADARKNRDVGNKEDKQELIEIHPDFLNALISAPNTNRNKGRVAYLLKAKNAVRKQRNLSTNFEDNLDILKSGRIENQFASSQIFEEEKYYARTTIESRTPAKQDTRSHHKQSFGEDDNLRVFIRTPQNSTLGLKCYTIPNDKYKKQT